MSLVGTVVRAELRQHLRDPAAILLTVGLPLVVYPLLGLAGHEAVERSTRSEDARVFDVATEPDFPLPANLRRVEVPDLRAAVDAHTVLAAARRTEDGAEIVWDAREPDSLTASLRLREALRDWRQAQNAQPLVSEDLTTPEAAGRRTVSAWLPVVLLFTLVTGGLYTALDLVTGERERGSLETLLTTAADRREILLGKALVVLGFTLASAALSAVGAYLGGRFAGGLDLPAAGLVATVGLFVPACLLLTAVLIAAAAWAPDFKSGQVLSIPVMFVPLLFAGAAVVPGVTLSPLTALVPITGSALAARDVLVGGASPGLVALATVAALAWSAGALWLAADLLGREEVLLGASSGRQRRLNGDYRADALAVGGLALLLLWFLAQKAQAIDAIWGMVFTQVACLAPLALVAPWWLGLPVRDTLRLHGAPLGEWVRAVVVGLGLPGVALLVGAAQAQVLPMPDSLFEGVFPDDVPLWQLVVTYAVLPGICEELLFRGAFFGLWRTRSGAWAAVGVTALAFGAFHLSVFRLLPTAVLGAALGVVSVRSRSVVPGMVAHACNNAVAMVALSQGWSLELGWPVGVGAVAALAALAWPSSLAGSATSRPARPGL